jgi:hypothetical protein
MFVSQPEVEQDGADDRVDEGSVTCVVGERAEAFETFRQRLGRGRNVKDGAIALVHHAYELIRSAESPRGVWFVEGPFGDAALNLVDGRDGERLFCQVTKYLAFRRFSGYRG